MARNNIVGFKDEKGNSLILKQDSEGNLVLPVGGEVKQVGSIVELYGATENDRPFADDVAIGAVYMAVDTQEIWQSNGTEWKVIN